MKLTPNLFALKKIKNALISVYYKDNLAAVVELLHQNQVQLYATGGTFDFIQAINIPVHEVESLTGYPSILDGRVKTLHPKVFGGILARSSEKEHQQQLKKYEIPAFDLVIVDLYPFEETLKQTDDKQRIIEKIDIGGISLIRAAAKNFEDVLVVPAAAYFNDLLSLLTKNQCASTQSDRLHFASLAFGVSSHYDSAIYNWIGQNDQSGVRLSLQNQTTLRYGENPHQKGSFYGRLDQLFEQLHGKEISYNNLLDLDAGLNLLQEFDETTFAILKHNNACGLACRDTVSEAYEQALAGDPVSAFGGVLLCNRPIDEKTAENINKLFFEIIVAPDFEKNTLEILKSRKNRIILRLRSVSLSNQQYKTALNGFLAQDKDVQTESEKDFKVVTSAKPNHQQIEDMVFANKVVKHSRSNAIVIAKNKQLIASGIGQTSRIDALKQAIAKAQSFELDLEHSVLASDAFFPFSDSVQIAFEAGVIAVVQPGGSVRDQESVAFCNQHGMRMVFTGFRHFKH
ncbi:MAG: bifunctional phosphoribosylaminoimidazolecarboxamide formyltransferase/IMP cyclohydrolase [Bacteroidales bacterium]|nr:bifunctional phosphoribosylaminoimidazolecarboxamide formyltransferase/IMP cyclohydrolase [Bacteroidales bacterium]